MAIVPKQRPKINNYRPYDHLANFTKTKMKKVQRGREDEVMRNAGILAGLG